MSDDPLTTDLLRQFCAARFRDGDAEFDAWLDAHDEQTKTEAGIGVLQILIGIFTELGNTAAVGTLTHILTETRKAMREAEGTDPE